MPRKGWAVELEGVVISGSWEEGDGCLLYPPEGLGNPPIRTEDVTYPQRDGVEHFADWYEPRIITLEASVCPGDDSCGASCPGSRAHVRDIQQAWGRKCDDVELIIWTDCSDSMECPEDSPGSPGGGPFEHWPLNGTPNTAVTVGNSGLDLVNPGGGTILYTPDGQGAEFSTTNTGSFTIARGLVQPDHQVSWLGAFKAPEVIPFEQSWDFETEADLADWESGTGTISRNTVNPISGTGDLLITWEESPFFLKGASAALPVGFVGDGLTQLQISWNALADAQSTFDGWNIILTDTVADENIAERVFPVGQTSYVVAVPVPVGMTADRITIALSLPPEPGETRIDNVIIRAINTAALPGEVSIATIRQSASEVAALRALVMPDRTLQIRDSTGAVLGTLGVLEPGVEYQLGLVANSSAPTSAFLANTTFETNSDGWSTFNGTAARDTAHAHSGVASLKASPTGLGSDVGASVIGAQPSTTYTVGLWVYCEATPGRALQVYGTSTNGSGVKTTSSATGVIPPLNTWTRLSHTFTTPEDMQSLCIGVILSGSSVVSTTIWVDDVTLGGLGTVQAALYGEHGGELEAFTATGNLTGNPLTGFDIGVVSSNASMATTWTDVKMESGRLSPIPPAGATLPIEDRSLVGPYGVIGRPRRADVQWLRGRSGCARLQLRFDARDHRMFVLDCEGGSEPQCVRTDPNVETTGRSYPRCYTGEGMCFDCDTGRESGDATATVIGTECATPEICFNGGLTNPVLRNLTTGEEIGIRGEVRADGPPICVDTETGTATQGGVSRTHLLTGNPRFRLVPGENQLRLISTSSTDGGYVETCWRAFVVSA